MKLLVVIPAYNEAENIVGVVEELKRTVPWADYVVVNDGSRDQTAALCRSHGYHMLDLPTNLGLTGAFQTGMRYAWEKGYDGALQLDGDGQHDPKYIPQMAELMEAEDLDLGIASRFLTKKRPQTLRMAGNRILDIAIRITTGKKVTDPTSGFRLYGRRILHSLAYGINESPEPDTIAFLLRSGVRMKEIQVTMRERTAGESYLSFGRSIRYMTQMCLDIFLVQWARKRSDTAWRGE